MRKPLNWLICAPTLLAVAFLFATLWLLHLGPDGHKPDLWKAIEKDGPFVAGSWVLCAALLSVSAIGLTLKASADSNARDELRKRSDARQLLRGEVLAFWDRLNQMKVHAGIESQVAWLKRLDEKRPNAGDNPVPNIYRRNLGDEWFMVSRSTPTILSQLPPNDTARYLSLSARSRHLVQRLNYLNGAPYSSQTTGFWIGYHNDTLEVLNSLAGPTREMLAALGESNADPLTFTLG